jgi:hypothetical protein
MHFPGRDFMLANVTIFQTSLDPPIPRAWSPKAAVRPTA